MSDIQKIASATEVLNKREKWESRVGNVMIASVVTGWLTSGTVEQVAAAFATVGVIGYVSMRVATMQAKKNIAKEQEAFVINQGADKNVRKFKDLQAVEKKIRRNRAIVFTAGIAAGVAGALTATHYGQPQLAHASVFVGVVVGALASAFTSMKSSVVTSEQKASLLNALETRRSQMDSAQTSPSASKPSL